MGDRLNGAALGFVLTVAPQEDGWTLPPADKRVPRWVELAEPIHRLASPRFAIGGEVKGRFRAVLIANDIGVVNFRGPCLEAKDGSYVL